jgi:hypothetical protein
MKNLHQMKNTSISLVNNFNKFENRQVLTERYKGE